MTVLQRDDDASSRSLAWTVRPRGWICDRSPTPELRSLFRYDGYVVCCPELLYLSFPRRLNLFRSNRNKSVRFPGIETHEESSNAGQPECAGSLSAGPRAWSVLLKPVFSTPYQGELRHDPEFDPSPDLA